MRDEFLSLDNYQSPAATRIPTTTWKDDYIGHRPHSSLGVRVPGQARGSLRCFRWGFGYCSDLTRAAQGHGPTTYIATRQRISGRSAAQSRRKPAEPSGPTQRPHKFK